MRSLSLALWSVLSLVGLACNDKVADTDTDTSASTGTSTGTSSPTSGTSTTAATTSAGTVEVTSSSSDTGTVTAPCDEDADCQLIESCCECDAAPIDAAIDPCRMPCDQTECSARNITDPAAVCRLGVCVLAAQSCSPGLVSCDALPPRCEPGLVPSVVAGCWGGCIPAHLCEQLPACTHELCGPGWMCVDSQSGSFAPHCEPMPPACAGVPGCSCAAAAFGELCGGACSDDGSRLLCEDGG